MNNSIGAFLFLVFLISCSESKEPSFKDEKDSISSGVYQDANSSEEKSVEEHPLDQFSELDTNVSFSEGVFDYGASYHLDGCNFDFGCDCCASVLIFHNDSCFYFIDDCMGDLSLTQGKFYILSNQLILKSDGICISKKYDPSKEYEPNVDEFILEDTIAKPYTITMDMKSCNDKIALMHKEDKETWIGLLTDQKVSDHIEKLRKDGIVSRFDKKSKSR